MKSQKAPPISGENVLREAMVLIDGLTFDGVRGGIVRNERLFISVVPDWEDDSRKTYKAQVSIQAMWHQKVSWELMRVSARPLQTSGFFVQHVLPLSARGHATFEGLDAGTYELRAYCRLAKFRAPDLDLDDQILNQALSGVAMAADPSTGSDSQPLTRGCSETEDIVVMIGKRKDLVTIEFATNAEHFAGQSIEFYVTNPDTKEIYTEMKSAVFSSSPLAGEVEFNFRSNVIELSFEAGEDIEVSYRMI